MDAVVISNKINKDCNVKIGGYKHSLVAILCMSLLLNNEVTLYNVPKIKEMEVFLKLFDLIGKRYAYKDEVLKLFESKIQIREIPDELTTQVHGTIYLLPVFLYLNRSIGLFNTGGCRIGDSDTYSSRPIEHMLSVMKQFGATVDKAKLRLKNGYKAAEVDIRKYSYDVNVLSGPMVSGATKTAILCAIKANNISIIKKPYMKADVLEMLDFLVVCGGYYEYKNDVLIIGPPKGKNNIHYRITSDVSEIVTFIAFSQFHKINITFRNIANKKIIERSLSNEIYYFRKMGVDFEWGDATLKVYATKNPSKIGKIKVNGETMYSDSQPFFLLLLIDANEETIIEDDVWSNRFEYAKELKKIGEPIQIINNNMVKTISTYTRKISYEEPLIAKDLRGAACLLLYASKNVGQKVKNVEHIERGYSHFWDKMKSLGIEYKLE